MCGQRLSGFRTGQAQIISCPRCGCERFVLPKSTLPSLLAPAVSENVRSRLRIWSFWRWPVVAIILSSLLFGAVILCVLELTRKTLYPPNVTAAQRLAEQRRVGREALQAGSYELAKQELAQAMRLSASVPEYTPQSRLFVELQQEYRQAALLADLLAEPLGDIIRNAIGWSDAEWAEVFRQRYAGKSIIFDDIIRRDSNRNHHHQLGISILNHSGRIDLDKLQMLPALPLEQPRRLFFGLRLQAIVRDRDGTWRIEPVPESCVLFTDASFLSGLSVSMDAELREVIKFQEERLANVPTELRGTK